MNVEIESPLQLRGKRRYRLASVLGNAIAGQMRPRGRPASVCGTSCWWYGRLYRRVGLEAARGSGRAERRAMPSILRAASAAVNVPR
jgi:hypothetical protein